MGAKYSYKWWEQFARQGNPIPWTKKMNFLLGVWAVAGKATLPDVESCWDAAAAVALSCHLEIQIDILAGELYLEFFIWFWGPGERYLEMDTGVLRRISMRISWA